MPDARILAIEPLTGLAAEIEGAIGPEAAVRLLALRGGTEVSIPTRAKGSVLASVIGDEATADMIAAFGPGKTVLPASEFRGMRGRRARGVGMLLDGATQDAVAIACDGHRVTVQGWRSRLRAAGLPPPSSTDERPPDDPQRAVHRPGLPGLQDGLHRRLHQGSRRLRPDHHDDQQQLARRDLRLARAVPAAPRVAGRRARHPRPRGAELRHRERRVRVHRRHPARGLRGRPAGRRPAHPQRRGHRARQHPDELVFPMLKAGFTTPCHGGRCTFDADHPRGGPTKDGADEGRGRRRTGPATSSPCRTSRPGPSPPDPSRTPRARSAPSSGPGARPLRVPEPHAARPLARLHDRRVPVRRARPGQRGLRALAARLARRRR